MKLSQTLQFLFAATLIAFAHTSLYSNSLTGSGQDSTQTLSDSVQLEVKGVAVSPSRLRMNGKPGETIIEKIKITNDTDIRNSFQLSFFDFEMNQLGKSQFVDPGDGKYSLSKWASISPSFVELEPGEKTEVTLTIQLPNNEEAHRAAWSILMVEQTQEREKLEVPGNNEETVAFGIIPTFAFGVFLYQNPPEVSKRQVDITNFKLDVSQGIPQMYLEVENAGTGISYCTAYIELTNLNTGEQEKLQVKHFTILPELVRYFSYNLPATLSPGKYSAVGVLDFGSNEEIQAAELEFEIAP